MRCKRYALIMSSPFDVQPPNWLVNVAKPVDGTALGRSLAQVGMSLANTFARDPDAPTDANWFDSRKGMDKGFAEVSNDQIDPQWRVKGQLMANQVLEQRAQLAAQGALAEERRKETSAWMEDAPRLAPWVTATPEERKGMSAPNAKSKIGMQTLQKQSLADQKYYTSQDQMQNRLEQERLKAEHSAGITTRVDDWNNALGSASPNTFSAISALKNSGRLSNGLPTPEAIALLNQDRTANGMTLYGTKASEYLEKPGKVSNEVKVQLDDLRSDESDLRRRIDAAAKAGEPTADMEAELDSIKQQRKALASGKPMDATKSAGKDTFQRDSEKLLHEINAATAQGDAKAASKKKEDLNVLNKTYALDRNGVVLNRKMKDADKIKAIASLPLGAPYYDEATGSLKKMTQDVKDIVSKVAAPETKPIEKTPRTGSSAWMATGPQDRKEYLSRRIGEIQTELDNLEVGGKSTYRRGELEKELDALKAEQKQKPTDSGTFKFLSTPASL